MAVTIRESQSYESGSGGYIQVHTLADLDVAGTDSYAIACGFNRNPASDVSSWTFEGNTPTAVKDSIDAGVVAASLFGYVIDFLDVYYQSYHWPAFNVADSFGVIWITNEVHGIFKLTPQRKFKSINSSQLSAPNGITADENGDVLIAASSSALFKWQVRAKSLEPISGPLFTKENGLANSGAVEKPIILKQGTNLLWVAQDQGLAKYNLATGQIEIIRADGSNSQHCQK